METMKLMVITMMTIAVGVNDCMCYKFYTFLIMRANFIFVITAFLVTNASLCT